MILGQSFLGEKFVWVVGGLKVSLVLALVQNQSKGFGFGLGPS